jgi:hypothetical protein
LLPGKKKKSKCRDIILIKLWSTIPLISTKRTITGHLNLLNTKKTTTYDVGNPGPGLGQAQKCGRVKPVNEIPTLPS